MKLKPPLLNIGDTEGFQDTDIFGREGFGNRLSNVVESLDSDSVIVLDGAWGTGKSTFVRQWSGLLRQRGLAVIQFDAFENDHQDDAFFALAGEISALAERTKVRKSTRTKFIDRATKAGKTFLPIAFRMALKAGTVGIFSSEDFKDLSDDAKEIARAFFEESALAASEIVEERIQKVDEDKATVEEFRAILGDVAQALREKAASKRTKDKTDQSEINEVASSNASVHLGPLVFIIDELDRCRPTFALNLIERMKHLFSVEGICFVLVTNLPELESVVQGTYGLTDPKKYLEKFYQLRVILPDKGAQPHQNFRDQYLDYLWKAMEVEPHSARHHQLVVQALSELANVHELPLRTLERIVLNVSLVYVAATEDSYLHPAGVAGLCVMKVQNPELYQRARNRSLTWSEANKFMLFEEWNMADDDRDWNSHFWQFITQSDDDLPDEDWVREYRAEFSRRSRTLDLTCDYIDEFYQRD